MADKPVNVDEIAADLSAQLRAATATLSDEQRAEVDATVKRALAEAGPELVRAAYPNGVGGYTPDRGAGAESRALDGTIYERLGMSLADVEFMHDIQDAARAADPRQPGPNEKTRNLVESVRKARAMDTAESGFGAQLVADASYVPQIWDGARESFSRIGALIQSRPMSGPVEKQPVLAAVPDMILVSETTSAIQSATEFGTQKVGTNEVTLTAQTLVAHYNFSGALVEDSIVPLVPLLRTAMSASQGKTMDKLAINGDTTNAATGNINLDDADPDDTSYYLAADGALHAALVDNTANTANHAGAALTYEALVALPSLMLDRTYDMHWGRPDNPNDLVYIGPPELDNDVLTLAEVVAAAQGRGVLPSDAPLRGELIRIGRYPYISTIALGMAEADGKQSTTGSNNTLGRILCFNPTGMLWGVRRAANVEMERRPGTDQWRLILSTRVALGRFTPTGAASGIEWSACLRNVLNG